MEEEIQQPKREKVVKQVVHNVRVVPEGNMDLKSSLLLTLFGLIIPSILSILLVTFINPNKELIYSLFLALFVITIICVLWIVVFFVIGGKFAKLSWDMFFDKTRGLIIRIFRNNQLEITTGKIAERIEFIKGDKLTEQNIMEENLHGSANFAGKVVAVMVQDNFENVNLLKEHPPDLENRDYNAAVLNGFDAGVFFARVFEANRLLIILVFCILAFATAAGSLYFAWGAQAQVTTVNSRVNDLNQSMTALIKQQQVLINNFKTSEIQVIQG